MSLQVRVGRPEVLLDGMAPGRDYEVWVQSLRGAETSEAQGIRARTRECILQVAAYSCFPQLSTGRGPQPYPVVPQPQLSPALPWDPWGSPKALVCPAATLATPRHLSFSDVSHDSARVSWEGTTRPVRLFRVSYVSGKGGHSGQVRAGLQVQGGDLFTGTSALSLPDRAPEFRVSGCDHIPRGSAPAVQGEWKAADPTPALVGPSPSQGG